MARSTDDEERFIGTLEIVTPLSYLMAIWAFVDELVMSQEASYASFLISEAGYTISQAYEAVAPIVGLIGLIGLAISLLFAESCYRAGRRFSVELRNLGIVWAVLTIVIVILSPLTFSTLNSGLLAYPDGTVYPPFSTGATFLYWIRHGTSFTPLFPLTAVSYTAKVLLALQLMITAETMGKKTGIALLRDGAAAILLGLGFWLVAVIGFFFFGVGLRRVAVQGMDAYRHPRRE